MHDYVGGVWAMHSGALLSKIVADVTVCAQKHPPQIAVGVNAFTRVQAREHNPFVVVGPSCIPLCWSQEHPLWWSQEHPLWWSQEHPLWWSQEHSPVEVTGAQPPSSGGLLFVSTRGVSQAVYQPLPVYLLVVWEGMHVHEVD